MRGDFHCAKYSSSIYANAAALSNFFAKRKKRQFGKEGNGVSSSVMHAGTSEFQYRRLCKLWLCSSSVLLMGGGGGKRYLVVHGGRGTFMLPPLVTLVQGTSLSVAHRVRQRKKSCGHSMCNNKNYNKNSNVHDVCLSTAAMGNHTVFFLGCLAMEHGANRYTYVRTSLLRKQTGDQDTFFFLFF